MPRRQQPKEQFHVSDAKDPRDLDHRETWAYSYEALPSSPGALWSTALPRPLRLSLAQSMPPPDVIDTYKGCHITNALQEQALALHQMSLTQGVLDTSDSMRIEPLSSLGEVSEICPPVPPLEIT